MAARCRTCRSCRPIGKGEFRLGPGNPDGSNKKTKPVLLVREDMLDPGTDGGFPCVRAVGGLGHRLPRRLAAMDPAGETLGIQPLLVLPRPVCVVTVARTGGATAATGPDFRRCVVRCHKMPKLSPVRRRGRGHGGLSDETKAAVDRYVRFIAKDRHRDHRQRRPVGFVAHFSADLERPARIVRHGPRDQWRLSMAHPFTPPCWARWACAANAVRPPAHVRDPRRQPDLRGPWNRDHPDTPRISLARTSGS